MDPCFWSQKSQPQGWELLSHRLDASSKTAPWCLGKAGKSGSTLQMNLEITFSPDHPSRRQEQNEGLSTAEIRCHHIGNILTSPTPKTELSKDPNPQSSYHLQPQDRTLSYKRQLSFYDVICSRVYSEISAGSPGCHQHSGPAVQALMAQLD